MHTLISALDLHNNSSCLHLTQINLIMHFQQQLFINAYMKYSILIHSQLASYGVQLCIFILYNIASQLAFVLQKLCAWTSIEVWQCPCNDSIASVYNAKGCDFFQYSTLSHQGPAKKVMPVKAGSHNHHYHIISFI